MDKLEKRICSFIESLNSSDFDLDFQMTLFPAAAGGFDEPVVNRYTCENEDDNCGNTINSTDCTNHSKTCEKSTNKAKCVNTEKVDHPNTVMTQCGS